MLQLLQGGALPKGSSVVGKGACFCTRHPVQQREISYALYSSFIAPEVVEKVEEGLITAIMEEASHAI